MNKEPCTIEHLQAIVPQYERWTVDKDGSLGEFDQPGSTMDADTGDIEEYHCNACGEYFTPDKRYSWPALQLAWEQAIKHLPHA